MKLYHYWRSSSSWRVRWAMALKKIDCEFVHVSLLDGASESPDHLKRDPLGHVPVLEFPDGKRLTESLAITGWLEAKAPSPSLYPADAFLRARTQQLAEIVNSGTHPLQNLDVLDHLSGDPETRKAWAVHFIAKGLSAFEYWVKETHRDLGKPVKFSVSDELTLSDLCLIPQLYNARRQSMDLSPFPHLLAIEKAALLTQSAIDSHPDRFEPK